MTFDINSPTTGFTATIEIKFLYRDAPSEIYRNIELKSFTIPPCSLVYNQDTFCDLVDSKGCDIDITSDNYEMSKIRKYAVGSIKVSKLSPDSATLSSIEFGDDLWIFILNNRDVIDFYEIDFDVRIHEHPCIVYFAKQLKKYKIDYEMSNHYNASYRFNESGLSYRTSEDAKKSITLQKYLATIGKLHD